MKATMGSSTTSLMRQQRGPPNPFLTGDGCGMVHYPSGNVAVMVTMVAGYKYYYFFDAIIGSNKLMANFCCGVGFIQHKNGQQRVVLSDKGGKVCSDKGLVTEEWDWDLHGKECGPPSGKLFFKINNFFMFSLSNMYDAEIEVKLTGLKHTFVLGKPPKSRTTLSDIMQRKHASGNMLATLTHMLDTPTLIQRQAAGAINPGVEAVKNAQKYGWSLPRISASGRETKAFCETLQLSGLSDTVSMNNTMTAHLSTYRTLVGRNTDACTFQQREALGYATMKAVPRSCPYRAEPPLIDGHRLECGASIPGPRKKIAPLEEMTLREILEHVSHAPVGQLIVVMFSTRHDEKCKVAEKMLAKHHCRFRKKAEKDYGSRLADMEAAAAAKQAAEEADAADPDPGAAAAKGKAKGKPGKPDKGAAEAEEAARLAAEAEAEAEAEEMARGPKSETVMFLVDCAKSKAPQKHFDFVVCPMYFMYFNGGLVYASSTFNGYSTAESDFLVQLGLSRKTGDKNKFYPPNFTMQLGTKKLTSIYGDTVKTL
jgi:hypothetical protein